MNFCVDCKHYLPSSISIPNCERTKRVDLVSGKDIYSSCSFERAGWEANHCGSRGVFFKPNAIPEDELDLAFPPREPEEETKVLGLRPARPIG